MNREWAEGLDPIDRELFIAWNRPVVADLHRSARRGDRAALSEARRLQSMLDACRKARR